VINIAQKNLLELINALTVGQPSRDIELHWLNTLGKIFETSQFVTQVSAIEHCKLSDDAQELLIPSLGNAQHYALNRVANTTFDHHDVHFVESLLKLSRQSCSIQDAVERGAAEERRRIARDLHDDVAARLLTLIHQLKDQHDINLARSLLKALRNAIYTLDTRTNTQITHALTDIRAELQDRLNTIGMQLAWLQTDTLGELTISPRQHINLQRMLHEVTTNVIRHANAHFLQISIDLEDNQLHIQACDDGSGFDINSCVPGKGINNIRTRTEELHGQVSWQINKGCCIDIRFPVSTLSTTGEMN
jgi:signal transduction histidine kinase